MAKLSYEDKIYLESFLQMGEGYLLDFNNTTLEKFVHDAVKIELYHDRYKKYGDSKAKRIRGIWDVESDYVVGKLLASLLDYYRAKRIAAPAYYKASADLEEKYSKICDRLLETSISQHIDVIQPSTDDADFTKLAETIRKSIENNEPELALDRMHTFYVKHIRNLCLSNGIEFKNEESLNAIFGKYVKYVEGQGVLESPMSLAIVKYSINLLEKYNDVRNNKSLAHDNKLLNYKESLFIFDTLARLKAFLDHIQEQVDYVAKIEATNQAQSIQWIDDLPF